MNGILETQHVAFLHHEQATQRAAQCTTAIPTERVLKQQRVNKFVKLNICVIHASTGDPKNQRGASQPQKTKGQT